MKIGIDLGGSHVGVGLVEEDKLIDTVDKIFTEEEKKNIEASILDNIDKAIDKLLAVHNMKIEDIERIGIASPGTISNGVIVKAGNLGIYDFDLVSKMKEKYPVPVHMRNDGKCAALAEKKFGAMKDYDDCVFVNIGTGIGGAVFLEGSLLEPKKYSGFELGHMIIEKDGIHCTCGKKGCFERYCSIRSLKERITKTLGIENRDISGQYMREELMVKYHDEVKKDLEDFLDHLVVGIGNLIDIFEPEVICFGGSFSYYEGNPLLEEFIRRINAKNTTFNEGNKSKFVTAILKNNAGIIGATIER